RAAADRSGRMANRSRGHRPASRYLWLARALRAARNARPHPRGNWLTQLPRRATALAAARVRTLREHKPVIQRLFQAARARPSRLFSFLLVGASLGLESGAGSLLAACQCA